MPFGTEDVSDDDLAFINTRVSPIRTLSEGEPYVILTTTNAAAKRINRAYLDALPGRSHRLMPASPEISQQTCSQPT